MGAETEVISEDVSEITEFPETQNVVETVEIEPITTNNNNSTSNKAAVWTILGIIFCGIGLAMSIGYLVKNRIITDSEAEQKLKNNTDSYDDPEEKIPINKEIIDSNNSTDLNNSTDTC